MCKSGRCLYSCGKKEKQDDIDDILGPCPYKSQFADGFFCDEDEDTPEYEEVNNNCKDVPLNGDEKVYDSSTYRKTYIMIREPWF